MAKKRRAKKRKLSRGEIKRYRAQLGELHKPFPILLAAGVALGAALVAFAVTRTAEV